MGLFDKKQSISRSRLKSSFRRDRGTIPETGGRRYHQRDRSKITKEVFGAKYGSEISKKDYRRAIRDLESAGKEAKTPTEKTRINRRVNYLRKLGGKSFRK